MLKRSMLLILLLVGCTRNNTRKVIATDRAPAAIGPYSQAIQSGNTLYLAGQLGIDPATGTFAEGGFEAQAKQALENLKAILEAAGFTLQDVVQCQVFLKDMSQYPQFNTLYSSYFSTQYPARAVVEVARLPRDGQIEIMMVAVKN